MKYVGTHKLTLTADTVKSLIEEEVLATFGDSWLRITDVYLPCIREIYVEFTTDPPPEEPPAADPSSSYGGTEPE